MAIVLVLLSHFTIYGYDRPTDHIALLAYRAASAGWVGVDLFLVLSGFLITGILFRAKGSRGFFLEFFARRTLRIFPLYFGFLTAAVVVLPHLAPHSVRVAAWVRESPWYWIYAGNIFVAIHGWSASEAQGLNHFWSLAVEEQFYLLWPVAVFFLNRRQLLGLCAAAAITGVALRVALVGMHIPIAAYVLMPARMDALAAGAIVALALEGPMSRARIGKIAQVMLGVFAVTLLALAVARRTPNPEDPVIATVGFSCLAGFFASLLATIVAPREWPLRSPFRLRIMRAFGTYSYGLYVIHHPLLLLLPPLWVAAWFRLYIPSDLISHLLALTLVFLLCVAAAAASWHLFEQPVLKLRKRLSEEAPLPKPNLSPKASAAS